MNINDAVVAQLEQADITTVFGNPGTQSLPLNEAIATTPGVEFIVVRHETAVSHSAWGYGESSEGMAATIVIPGPGDMNALNGLKNAYNDCTPLLHIAVETEPELRGGDAIHETPPDTYDNIVKKNIIVKTPESTLAELQGAIHVAETPPKGPVRLGIPKNFLTMDVPLADLKFESSTECISPAEGKIRDAVDLLNDADRPVIVAGGGIRAASAANKLRQLADQIDAPVIQSFKGMGAIPGDHPLNAGVLFNGAPSAVSACLADADVVLAVGTDLDAVATNGWEIEIPGDLIHITMHPSDIGVGYRPTVGIVADAKLTLQRLAYLCQDCINEGAERAGQVQDAIEKYLAPLQKKDPLTSVAALTTIQESLPDDSIITVDAGGFRLWSVLTMTPQSPDSYVQPGSWASMGTGLPSGIGAKTANPDSNVVVLTGDGGLLMCLHELHTAVSNDLNITVLVFNNNDYAIISEDARHNYEGIEDGYSWNDAPISFTTIAEGFGMKAHRCNSASDLSESLRETFSNSEPTLVEIHIDPAEPQSTNWQPH